MLGFINFLTINFPSSPSRLLVSSLQWPLSVLPPFAHPQHCLQQPGSCPCFCLKRLFQRLPAIGGKTVRGDTRISCFGFHWSSSSPQEPSPLVAPQTACAGWPAASDRGSDASTFAAGRWCQQLLTLTHFAIASPLRKLQALNLEASKKKSTTRIGQGNWDYVHPTLRVKGCPIFRDPLVLST